MKTNIELNGTNKPVELTDEQMENVNGGMKIFVFDKPKFVTTFLRLFFKVKEKPEPGPEPQIPAPVIIGPAVTDIEVDKDSKLS